MPRSPEEPSALPPAFEQRLGEVLARADKVLAAALLSPAKQAAEAAANVEEARRKIPVLTAAFENAVRRFEASAQQVEAHIREKRRERTLGSPGNAGKGGSRGPVDREAQLAALDAEIKDYEASMTRLQKMVEVEIASGDEWERRAMLAVKCDDDSLARESLARRKMHLRLAASYQTEATAGAAIVAELKTMADALRA